MKKPARKAKTAVQVFEAEDQPMDPGIREDMLQLAKEGSARDQAKAK